MNRFLTALAVIGVFAGLALMLAGYLPWAARWTIEADTAIPVALLLVFAVTSALCSTFRRKPR